MARQKRNRYELINTDPRVMQWLHAKHVLFPDAEKIVVELACGRGEYTVGLAEKTREGISQYSPNTLFVGIDQNGNRIGVGLKKTHALWLQNVRFVCGIIHHLTNWFAPASIDDIWIIHPDPRPKDRDIKRRLTHPRFLDLYQAVLKPEGILRLKTDDRDLFDYSIEQLALYGRESIKVTYDLYDDTAALKEHFGIQTHYEKLGVNEGRKICYGMWKKKWD